MGKVDDLSRSINVSGSARFELFIRSQLSVRSYKWSMFSVKGRVKYDYHMKMLESAYIKSYQPSLIKLEWLVGLKLFTL